MAKPVQVVITGKVLSQTLVVPFSHAGGPQFYVAGATTVEQAVLYQVPRFEVRVDGGGTYGAVRFGLQNLGILPPAAKRRCDAGLGAAQACVPSWVPGYSPHSFAGSSRAGALRLIAGKGFLVHEGADTRKGQVGGSLGCVEILDGGWNGFLADLEKVGGDTCPNLAAAGKIQVVIEAAAFPVAVLLPRK